MNNLLSEYFGFYFELNIELNNFLARFNEKMDIQNVSAKVTRPERQKGTNGEVKQAQRPITFKSGPGGPPDFRL